MRQNRAINCIGTQTSCKQCGTCCKKGGAALHGEDLFLIQNKSILRSNCITLRKGEFAYNPVTETIEAIPREIVKLRGKGGEWVCCYLDLRNNSCGIYENRPLACRTLKCWDPKESLELTGNDLLSREMILQNEKQLFKLVIEYEQEFLLPDFTMLSQNLKRNTAKMIQTLETMINRDLTFRDKQVQQSSLVAKEELFLFGRPLFQLLQPFGVNIFQNGDHLCLKIQ